MSLSLWFKYKVFKRYDEVMVEWCVDAYEQGWTKVDVKKELLLKPHPKYPWKEILYVFKQVSKQLKGGKK